MSQYPLCEKYGLKPMTLSEIQRYQGQSNANFTYIRTGEIEALLSSGTPIKGFYESKEQYKDYQGWVFSENAVDDPTQPDTHEALVIGIKPIEKEQPVSVDEVVEALEMAFSRPDWIEASNKAKDLINRLQKAGIK